MKNISIISFVLFGILLIPTPLFAQKKAKKKAIEDTNNWRYEIECLGTGKQGTYLLKIWSYSKNQDVAIESAKRNAVHGVIFKGFPGGDGCIGQNPLADKVNLEQEYESFFKSFFSDGGKYLKFVSLTSNGNIAAGDRIKVNKKEYKIGVIVSVRKDELRKDLEAAAIIKSLTSGF